MNQVVDIGPKKVKLQDVLDVYEDHIINLIKQYVDKLDRNSYCERQLLRSINKSKLDNVKISIKYIFSLPINERLDYIEKKMMKAMDDKIERLYFDYIGKKHHPELHAHKNLNRQYIINCIRELKSYNVECQDNYSIYYQ